jgi:hypothetical protein
MNLFSTTQFPSAKEINTKANAFRQRKSDLDQRTSRLTVGDTDSPEALAIKTETTLLFAEIAKLDEKFADSGPQDTSRNDANPTIPLDFLKAVDTAGGQLLASFLDRFKDPQGYHSALAIYRTEVGHLVRQFTVTLEDSHKASIYGRFGYLMEILPGRTPPFPLLTASVVSGIDIVLSEVPESIKEVSTLPQFSFHAALRATLTSRCKCRACQWTLTGHSFDDTYIQA